MIGNAEVLRKAFDSKGGGGNFIVIAHDGNRYETKYLHLSKTEPFIKPGAGVKKGVIISEVGITGGRTTGPHL